MDNHFRHTKIVATIGPSSNSPAMIRQMILAGMDVARLNFSHGSYEDHEKVIASIRSISKELDTPITILQDLQGPKIRVGKLQKPDGSSKEMELVKGGLVHLLPENEYHEDPDCLPVDYPYIASEAKPGMQVLMDDGLLELSIESVSGSKVTCRIIEGGIIRSRKGVNFPQLNLRLPSLTEKDKLDLTFGLEQGVDWISLSFVRSAEDLVELKKYIGDKGYRKPVIAKIEKHQAVENLDSILQEVHGIMVARGDLGVELSPEKVPLIQKHIIEQCNRRGIPVITATQMLESMIREPRPTRAEANDVANAIIDGTDCIMLSGESAVGSFPLKAIEMMNRIACEVEKQIPFKNYPPSGHSGTITMAEAAGVMEKIIHPRCIAVMTATGNSARYVAAERSKVPVYAITGDPAVYHGLNLIWGIKPLLTGETAATFEGLISLAEKVLIKHGLARKGDKVIIMGGIPANVPGGTNFIKIHTII